MIFGGAALWDADQATADRVLDLLLAHGVNHIDTAPRYGNAEARIGPWMDRHRDAFFLATKTRSRDHASAFDACCAWDGGRSGADGARRRVRPT